MRSNVSLFVAAALILAVCSLGARQQPPPPQPAQGQGGRAGQQQARDRAQIAPQGTGVISGRVLAADTGRGVKRARVAVAAGGPGNGRGNGMAITDDQGRFAIGGLAPGNYNVSASKAGFVDAAYGQRRPLQPGTPLPLADGQSATGIDLRLIRGGVITGRISDEDGEALARAMVTIQRYQYVRGERQLTPAGADQTDDRGQYRVFGLPAGDYYVSVSTAGLGDLIARGMQQLAAGIAAGGRGGRGAAGGGLAGLLAPDQPDSSTTGYAPTYYPGVVSTAEAGKLTVGPGQELASIDFQIQLVPLATVSGIVAGAQDTAASVLLVPQDTRGGAGRLGGQTFNGRTLPDGTFAIAGVPPGHYTAIARSGGGRGGDPRTAVQAVVVGGQNVDGVALMLQPGVTLSGNITVESSGTPSPADYSIFRVDVLDVDPLPGAGFGGRGGRGGPFGGTNGVDKNGSFTLTNLQPGQHYIRVTGGGAQGGGQWTLKAATIGGADAADVPFEIKPGTNIDNVNVVLTDRPSELSGTVTTAQNAAVSGVTVIAFAADPQYWRAQSRRIATSRSGQTGAYRMRGLPAGDYYVIATDDVEQGEWFDPAYLDGVKNKATHVTVKDGETRTLDLRGPG